MEHEDTDALRQRFLEEMAETALAKIEALRRLETATPHQLDRIYSILHQVRTVRRKLIAMYRRLSRELDDGDDLEAA